MSTFSNNYLLVIPFRLSWSLIFCIVSFTFTLNRDSYLIVVISTAFYEGFLDETVLSEGKVCYLVTAA